MAKQRGPITAVELQAQLESDPDWVARRKQRDDMFAALRARLHIEQEPLLADLRAVGMTAQSVWDLVNTSARYPLAIPVLLKHLLLPYCDRIREGIARALATPDARESWPLLVAEYRKAPIGYEEDEATMGQSRRLSTKHGLAVALAAITTNEKLGELVELLKDRSLGESRILLLGPLRRRKSPVVIQALQQLSLDPDLCKEIAAWKRKDLAAPPSNELH